jgi:hypothetical protein
MRLACFSLAYGMSKHYMMTHAKTQDTNDRRKKKRERKKESKKEKFAG